MWLHGDIAPHTFNFSAVPGSHCVQGCVSLRSGLDDWEQKKSPVPAGNQTPFTGPFSPWPKHCTD